MHDSMMFGRPCAKVFADALIGEAGRDESVVAVHAAMGGGTGLNHFEKFFADRTFDVGKGDVESLRTRTRTRTRTRITQSLS